ncbi:hypothetical protein STEG23_007554, partial [Scotinomys teguina]
SPKDVFAHKQQEEILRTRRPHSQRGGVGEYDSCQYWKRLDSPFQPKRELFRCPWKSRLISFQDVVKLATLFIVIKDTP